MFIPIKGQTYLVSFKTPGECVGGWANEFNEYINRPFKITITEVFPAQLAFTEKTEFRFKIQGIEDTWYAGVSNFIWLFESERKDHLPEWL